ncbi:MAG: LptA/OstA family protein [Vicinamibacterales bacterium]
MRWQKIARLAIAAIVIVFVAVVFVALRRPGPAKVPDPTPPRRSAETVSEAGAFESKHFTSDGKLSFFIRGEAMDTFPDGRKIGRNATLTLPDRDGRTCDIFAPAMEVIAPEEGQARVSVGKMSGGVKLNCSDGLVMTSNEATYDEKTEVVSVPGDVQFSRGRLTGWGKGATYDQKRDVVWLLADARIKVTPDETGAGAAEATSGSAGLARNEHYVRLTAPAHLVSEGRTIDADDITIQLTDDDRLMETMTLRGNSRITGAPGSAATEGMSANDIDLTFAPDGRTLQEARLMENASVELPGGGAGTRRITGRSIDMTFGPDGTAVTRLAANQNVEVVLPAAAGTPERRITSATLNANGTTAIETATFEGGVTFREIRPAQRGAPAAERTSRSRTLIVQTEPGLGNIKQADFRGNVDIQDGATSAEGQRAIYRVAEDNFDLAPSNDPGPPPSVNDGRVLVRARTITFGITSKMLRAETDVRSSIEPSKPSADKPEAAGKSTAATGKPAPAAAGGSKAARQEGGKLPSMLKQDEPVNVTSNRLEYDGAAGKATYTGNAKLFQGNTFVSGDTIVVDDKTANLNARGNVRSVMFFEEEDSATKKKRLVQTTATGDTLVYEEAKRLATYTTGPSAKAHVVGTQGDVTADTIQLFLKEGANELQRAEADGQVVVKEGFRTATGTHLTYTPENETYVMHGTPVVIEERASATDCKITEGSVLNFRRTNVDVRINGNGVSPVNVKQCPPKQP